jgi:hypothetical protein
LLLIFGNASSDASRVLLDNIRPASGKLQGQFTRMIQSQKFPKDCKVLLDCSFTS